MKTKVKSTMGLIIKNKKHLYTRFPLILAVIGALALSPVLIGLIGAWITEVTTGQPCHEGNCVWGALPWLFFFTFPVAVVVFVIVLIIVVLDARKLPPPQK